MVILMLANLNQSWKWNQWQTMQYAQIEAIFVDLPFCMWCAFMIVKSAGG